MRKTFVLDTNVLLHNAESVESFSDNEVVLPMEVLEELDKFKAHSNELGRNARQVVRRIDALREQGNLRDGVPLGNGGLLRIMARRFAPDGFTLSDDVPDNRILRLAYTLHCEGCRVIFVSKDINARLKADALGLQAEDFEKQKVNFDEFYTGLSDATVHADTIGAFFKADTLDVPGVGSFPNEFVLLRDAANEKHTGLGRVVAPGRLTHLCKDYERVWNVAPKNREQRLALELLMDPMVQIVTLVGQAGSGKTLLALAAGLQSVLKRQLYDCVLVSRPIIPLGKDIGYLPGAKEEKLSHWMQPIFDNLSFLLADHGKAREEARQPVYADVDKFISDRTIQLEALTYIRGRSIPRQFVIVDEAQNLTPHEVKTIISRAGEGTKMVLTGDAYQIDNPYLDAASNGLTYAAERLKSLPLHGHIMLRKSERSKLAAAAAELL